MKTNSEVAVDFSDIEKIINYRFNDKELLVTAFTHSSYANEHKRATDYERLEFLGDAVLGYIVGKRLFGFYPSAKEGELTKRRAALVSADTLSEIIDEYGLIGYMRVGTGNAHEDVLRSENVKCDLFEAIVGAIVLDNGGSFVKAEKFIWEKMEKYLSRPCVDYKSKTLEYCAKRKLKCIIDTREIDGKDKSFASAIYLEGEKVAEGKGRNKHSAERVACRFFYENIVEKEA